MIKTYWQDIPEGRENAITYAELCVMWNCSERTVRHILHNLSREDNGDDYILIRSSHGKGFFKTKDINEIEKYRKECVNRAVHTFAPLKKINRVAQKQGYDTTLFELEGLINGKPDNQFAC